MSLSREGTLILDYDSDSGILRLNRDQVPEGTLEKLSKQIENGEEVCISIRPLTRTQTLLKGIKQVRYLSPEEKTSVENFPY